MSSNDTEPKAKKQRVDSGEDQDVSMTIGAVNDGISPQVQNEAVKTVSSTPVPGSYSFTITNGLYNISGLIIHVFLKIRTQD